MQGMALGEYFAFLRQFFIRPGEVGSVLPSSRALSHALLSVPNRDQARIVLEYGPGTGAVTAEILRCFRRLESLTLIEINPDFAGLLREKFPKLKVLPISVTELDQQVLPNFGKVDVIVSGLPFSVMPWSLVESAIDRSHAALKPGGCFSTFLYVHTYHLPRVRRFRMLLNSRFAETKTHLEWRNFPPAYVVQSFKA